MPVRWQVTGAVGVGLLGVPLVRLFWTGVAPPLRFETGRVQFRCSPSQSALHEAAFWRVRAVQLADDDCDDARAALGMWDPAADFHPKAARRQFLRCDRAGYLRRARAAAGCAAARARTSRERSRAVRELAQDVQAGRSGSGL